MKVLALHQLINDPHIKAYPDALCYFCKIGSHEKQMLYVIQYSKNAL